MAAVLGVTAFAGCKKEKHNYIWDVESEVKATCTTEGKRRGICSECGDVKEESLPIDPDNHNYGEWEVKKYPDVGNKGEAVKKCTYNSAHELKAELPDLSDIAGSYISDTVTKPATAISAGTRELVLENAAGNITFEVEIPKREVETVEDAVLLGSSLGDMVRSASGHYSDTYTGDQSSGAIRQENDFSYYYGDGYTHITDDGANQEYWITRDGEGKVFGILEGGGSYPHAAENITEDYLLGFGYSSGANSMRTFGAENTLLLNYERAQTALEQGTAVLYDEDIVALPGGGFKAWFMYSYYENPNFARYRLDFTLNATGVITSLTLSTKIIRAYMIEEDSRGNKLFYDNGDMVYAEEYETENGANVYETDANGIVYDGVKTDYKGTVLKERVVNSDGSVEFKDIPRPKPGNRGGDTERYYYSDDHSEVSKREIVYDAPVLKTPDDVVPECKYSSDDLYITSFDAQYQNKLIGEEGLKMSANETVIFELCDIKPSTASVEYDPVRLYLRTGTRDIQLTSEHNDNSYRTMGFFSIVDVGTSANPKKVGRVTLNARYAGELTLVLKTKGGKFEKEIKLNIGKGVPTDMSAEVYAYSDADGRERHLWTPYDSTSSAIVMYVGETLRMRAMAPSSEAQYVDASFNAAIGLGEDPRITFTDDVDFNGVTVSEAVPHVAGTYAVYLTFNRDQTKFKYFNVEVREAPDMRPAIRGADGKGAEYTARSQYIKLTSDNSSPAPADIKIKFHPGSAWARGTITVDIGGNTAEYSYVYDTTAHTLTTEYVSGISGTTLDFSFERNEMYKIALRHSIGYGNNTEKLVLTQVEAES